MSDVGREVELEQLALDAYKLADALVDVFGALADCLYGRDLDAIHARMVKLGVIGADDA